MNKPTFHIRPYEEKDIDAVATLLHELQEEVVQMDPSGRRIPFTDGGHAFAQAVLAKLDRT